LNGGRELEIVRQKDPFTGSLLQRTIDGVNRLAHNLGAGVIGPAPAPPPVESTQVKGTLSNNVLTAPGEILHFVHTHNAPIQRGIQYVTEIDVDPNFPNPHPIDTGSSRSGFVHLPTKDDSNNPVGYYLRVTAQMPGGHPAKPTVFGGVQGPTKIVMGGSTSMSLLPSQSGGTAKPGQGGQGLGKIQSRGPVGGPKRNLLTSNK
jgi:hypothetical protein